MYDALILADRPVAYWPLSGINGDTSLAGGYHLQRHGTIGRCTWVDGATPAALLDGATAYLEAPSDLQFSVSTTGALTVEAWLRPDTLVFPHVEGSGYVHWLSKADSDRAEWAARIYSANNSEGRANRISGYAFNLAGGLGAGSYAQDTVTPGQWIHYALTIQTRPATGGGYTRLYVNGVQRDQDPLSGYSIVPAPGTAPLRIGGTGRSLLAGAIAKVAVYGHELTPDRIAAHHAAA